jgi:RNA polymerase sigma factor for flagellar operon FliA
VKKSPLSDVQKYYVIGGVKLQREEIVHRYLHLVKYVAGRASVNLPSNVEINDLINDGIVGLMDAIEKYDDARGVKFETYAITRINGAIVDALRSLDWVPRAVRRRARELERTHQRLELELGRAPDERELAAGLGISVRELDRLTARVRDGALLSLEDVLPNGRGHEVALADTLEDERSDVTAEVEGRELRAELVRAVNSLPAQERTVIHLCYFKGQTLKEIKTALGVSESRISQVHSHAVVRLRQRLRELRAELGYREAAPAQTQAERSSRGEISPVPPPRSRRQPAPR